MFQTMGLDEFLRKLEATKHMPWVVGPTGAIRCGAGCPITMVATGDSGVSAGYAGGYADRLGLEPRLKCNIIAAADNSLITFSSEKTVEIRRNMLSVLGLKPE